MARGGFCLACRTRTGLVTAYYWGLAHTLQPGNFPVCLLSTSIPAWEPARASSGPFSIDQSRGTVSVPVTGYLPLRPLSSRVWSRASCNCAVRLLLNRPTESA
jgi:hypothetical protein